MRGERVDESDANGWNIVSTLSGDDLFQTVANARTKEAKRAAPAATSREIVPGAVEPQRADQRVRVREFVKPGA